jgi:hypothetical protein
MGKSFSASTPASGGKYQVYTLAIPAGVLWFHVPSRGIVQLSEHCLAYDYVQQRGHQNIGD